MSYDRRTAAGPKNYEALKKKMQDVQRVNSISEALYAEIQSDPESIPHPYDSGELLSLVRAAKKGIVEKGTSLQRSLDTLSQHFKKFMRGAK